MADCTIPTHRGFRNILGQKFGRLLVVSFAGIKKQKSWWTCRCDCGEVRIIAASKLLNGHTKSCTCLQKEIVSKTMTTHGCSGTRMFWVWSKMIDRCTNTNSRYYYNYGGRGISVCDSWMKFENFIRDMGERPTEFHSIDRIDNNGNYCPENCRWTTRHHQSRNKRTNIMITNNGTTLCATDWDKRLGGRNGLVQKRLRLGWSITDALTLKPHLGNKVIRMALHRV